MLFRSGMGIAIAILEELRNSGCLFLVTTHYPEVKEYAEHTTGIQNARMEFDKQTLQPLYKMVIGEAGESCAFHIAKKLGMPQRMLETAKRAAYGPDNYVCEVQREKCKKDTSSLKKIKKAKKTAVRTELSQKFQIGDSVMIYPDKKIGIVCQPVNEKGELRVQMQNKKIWVK